MACPTMISIYGTVFNSAKTIRKSIITLIEALPDFCEEYELIIVDNYSTDGTDKIIGDFTATYKNIKLIRTRCSRGRGRDIALKNTTGDYVFYVDFDDYFKSQFGRLIDRLRHVCVEKELWGLGFSTRSTAIDRIGGWKDMNFAEDLEYYCRAIARQIRVKSPLVPNFMISAKVKGSRERRYSSNTLDFMRRRSEYIIDSIKGRNLGPSYFVRSKGSRLSFNLLPLIFLSCIFRPMAFRYSKQLTNNQLLYLKEEYVLPEEIGLPKNWLYKQWDEMKMNADIVKKRLKELSHQDINCYYDLENDRLMIARNPDFLHVELNQVYETMTYF
jgi:glycosyltransferase involved in cell wall biosynthesis